MAQTYNFPTTKQYTSIPQVQFTINIEGSPLDLTDAIITMWLKTDEEYEADTAIPDTRKFTSVDTENFEITDAANGIFIFKTQKIDVAPGVYNYDIRILLPSGTIHTFVEGTWTITKAVTRG